MNRVATGVRFGCEGVASPFTRGRKAGRHQMRKFLIIGALATTALIQAQPSEAYFRGAWCAKMDNGGGNVSERCDFPTFASCRRWVNAQPKSFCVQNQWSATNWGIDEDYDGNRFNHIYR
jgi:hypothetical protein